MAWLRLILARAAVAIAALQVAGALTVAGALLARPADPDCPHHETGRACVMANCPMREAHRPAPEPGQSQLVCPTDELPFTVAFGPLGDAPVSISGPTSDGSDPHAPLPRRVPADHVAPVPSPPPRA